MPNNYRPNAVRNGPMNSPIAVQGLEEGDLHPGQIRTMEEQTKAQDQARLAEQEAGKPRTPGFGMRPQASGGVILVVAVGGIIALFVIFTLLGLLGIRLG